ncbi:MAG: hypothetical protein IJA60_05600 [Clostridia bacterium]|nr:hypothetical protein [Clostridia bacterium]
MKKIIIVLMIMLFAISCFAQEEPTYSTANDLYQSWQGEYPSYVCGVWSTDGSMENLTFAVLDNEDGEAGKQEILNMIENDATVTIVYQKISRNELAKVQEELLPYFEKQIGLVWSALDEMENEIDLGILEDRQNDPETIAMIEELKNKYGDIFEIEYSKSPVTTLEIGFTDENLVMESQSNSWYYLVFSVLLLAIAAVFVLFAKKNGLLVKQTNAGNLTEHALPSVKEAENMVKASNAVVSESLDEKIMSDIK